jgi:hypothetical protein
MRARHQRLSNNREPEFTDLEIITIWLFAHSEGCFEKKMMQRLIRKYWREWFPHLSSYQTFVLQLNRLEPTFQTFEAVLAEALASRRTPKLDHMVDSLPVMLARHGHYLWRAWRVALPTSDTVPPRRRAFMACVCTAWRNDGRAISATPTFLCTLFIYLIWLLRPPA